ncbi:MAG: hypothetical protein JXM73_14835 [Anaerolineae bacterium]|nr:hypothetical protein [Anaerolineae bacterium]
MPEYIFDTTVLSNFAAVKRIDLLAARYRHVAFTTIEVIDELRRGVKAGYAYLDPILRVMDSDGPDSWLRVLGSLSITEQRLRVEFDDRLDAGEASCLAWAISKGLTLVTDDLVARRLAQERQVSLTGTLGILVALVRDRVLSLSDANSLLTDMIRRRYRSPVDSLDAFI